MNDEARNLLGRNAMTQPALLADALTVRLGMTDPVDILDGISFRLEAGRTLGVVGESGCGKSMTALAVMGLVPAPNRITGRLSLGGADLLGMSETALRRLRGKRMAMIFQEPMTALNPVVAVGTQIAEMLEVHDGVSTREARRRAVVLLREVGIAAAEPRAGAYPHQLSGGMRQRVMIAMAIACRPALLIADEPTTALDVSVQAQILDLLLELQRNEGMAMLFISHDLGVISEMADDVMVMYAGRVVEQGRAAEVIGAPGHPYTKGLIETVPDISRRQRLLPVIPGGVPDPRRRGAGCGFAPRCALAEAVCVAAVPPLSGGAHRVACVHR
jgi:ABC-type dipeptide/oligopeptide/nickel transport system ATPase component